MGYSPWDRKESDMTGQLSTAQNISGMSVKQFNLLLLVKPLSHRQRTLRTKESKYVKKKKKKTNFTAMAIALSFLKLRIGKKTNSFFTMSLPFAYVLFPFFRKCPYL